MPEHIQLAGSERAHPRNSTAAGNIHPDKNIELTLTLRRNPSAARLQPHLRHRLSRQEFAVSRGADTSDIQKVKAFAAANGFAVIRVHPSARTVQIAGPLGKLATLFGANLRLSSMDGQVFRTREGTLRVPAELASCVVGVFGFDNRPAAIPHHHVRDLAHAAKTYTPIEVAQLYNFPSNKGKGQTIAMIELGGGYQDEDLQAYWKQMGVTPVNVVPVSVGGAQNAPDGDPDGADGEVALDIEVAGAMAPGATIAVYFAPNTDEGFLNAINAAIHDSVCKPSVISISWGSAENEWIGQTKNAFNAAFQDAAMLGITVCAAAGDNGSSDGENDNAPHVDFPASSPWVLACGGTRLISANGKTTSETVWNDGTWGGATGGGVSTYFSQPNYQTKSNVPKPTGTANGNGRGVPDVAGNADPESGFRVLVDGKASAVGGTSAVAPLWSALIALCNEQLGKNIGWIHPALYSTLAGTDALRDITTGNNGAYHAAKGWDCCTGLGTPNGMAILNALKQSQKSH